MFGGARRRRPPNLPLNSANPDPSAATAAASAFMTATNQDPNRALASAAASAALRARPTTPTNVGDVQTKRTARRSASVSSTANAGQSTRRPSGGLERRGSSGSMTERTFRSPSPGRSAPATKVEPHPPVPQIPANHRKTKSSGAPGVGMQVFRTASQKMASGHPSWYTQPTGDTSNVRRSDAAMRKSTPPPARPVSGSGQPPRSESQSPSVNYSYPTTFRAQSPPASPQSASNPQWSEPPPRTPASPPRSSKASTSSSTSGKPDQQMVYDPNSRRMVPKANIEAAVVHRIQEAAERQPKKKRNTDGSLQREGSRLAKGTMGRAKGTAVNEPQRQQSTAQREQYSPQSPQTKSIGDTLILEQPKRETKVDSQERTDRAAYEDQLQSQADTRAPILPRSQKPEQVGTRHFTPTQGALRHPSVVPEESSDEEGQKQTQSLPQNALDVLDAVPTRQAKFEDPQSTKIGPHSTSGKKNEETPVSISSPGQSQVRGASGVGFVENKPVTELSRDSSSVRRSSSNSPARQARFATSPPESLAVRHAPLPRSASPIKSALKHSAANRDGSPSDNSSDLSRSRGVSPNQQESSVSRKKSVRVSFDDRNTMVVGESAHAEGTDSPVMPSPQQPKRPWYSSLGRSKKKDYALDDDEVMQPRPALPSFGSVREKIAREPEEQRPLVRPSEPTYAPGAPPSPDLRPQSASTLAESEAYETPNLEQSNDNAIGSVLAQEQASRNEANISRFREPLPPVVTSIEGNGYVSDSVFSSDSDNEQVDRAANSSDAEVIPSTQTTQITQPDLHSNFTSAPAHPKTTAPAVPVTTTTPATAPDAPQENVPAISIIQPSPMTPEHTSRSAPAAKAHYFDVPGGFPGEDSDDNKMGPKAPSRVDSVREPTTQVQPSQTATLPQTTLATTLQAATATEDESVDGSEESIYSDAYEDLDEDNNGGFQSLDAVVESPVSKTTPSQVPELPADIPATITDQSQSQASATASAPTQHAVLPQDPEDWDQIRTFWRSLTAEKRRQLELDAVEDAGTEGDREEVAQPIRRANSKRKSAEQKQLGPKIHTQDPPSTSQTPQAAHPDRTYMIQPGSKADHAPFSTSPKQLRMRTSMREEQPAKVTKVPPSKGMRKSMRANDDGGAEQARRASYHGDMGKNERTNSTSTAAAAATRSVPRASSESKPALQRRGSDASESSFKRSRAVSGDGFSFRRTMRSQSPERTKGSGRFSLRSLSPQDAASRHGPVAGTPTNAPSGMMRHSLRSGSTSADEAKRSSMQFPSFGRSSKRPATSHSRKSSRFDDSSDEDNGAPSGFRSRFDDSSDEDEARPGTSAQAHGRAKGRLRASATAPVMPRRATPVLEEDSPELPDSDDDMPSLLQSPQSKAAAAAAASHLGRTTSGSSALGTSTLSRAGLGRGNIPTSTSTPAMPERERRNSIMSILRRNKKATNADKIQRSELADSAARRDTKLERNAGQLKELHAGQASSPKLQKKSSANRADNWPLPQDAHLARPRSSGNLLEHSNTTGALPRPGFVERRSTAMGLGATQDDATDAMTVDGSEPGKKKKKFGALRRMFRLDD
ncbi:hypothetical protein F4780DRAFT_431040 [Xylariomycetidae sp. FL0641]|nr:hypothetical protein F4780DRAFT_431040 [Xylariomycetidae sp. FL0641]